MIMALYRRLSKEDVDDGYSGKNFDHLGITQLLEDVRSGKVYGIAVKDLSYFGRNHIEVGNYVEQIFPFPGVRFIAVSDNFDSLKGSVGLDIGFRNLMLFLYAAGGDTTLQIAGKLNREAIPTPGVYKNRGVNANYEFKNQKSNLWNASQVGIIIRNEVYIGTFIGWKLSTVRPWEIKRNEESEYIKIEEHHEGLVTEELFREAQKAIRGILKLYGK